MLYECVIVDIPLPFAYQTIPLLPPQPQLLQLQRLLVLTVNVPIRSDVQKVPVCHCPIIPALTVTGGRLTEDTPHHSRPTDHPGPQRQRRKVMTSIVGRPMVAVVCMQCAAILCCVAENRLALERP